jgi:putative acetyltransferase
VIAAAFAGPDTPGPRDPVEATLLDALRTCGGWLPELSFVAVQEKAGGKANGKTGEKTGEEAGEKEVTGHVVCTRGHADGVPALGLGPIGVRPDHQRHGTGLALMHAVLGAAGALGEPLVALLGSPACYGR